MTNSQGVLGKSATSFKTNEIDDDEEEDAYLIKSSEPEAKLAKALEMKNPHDTINEADEEEEEKEEPLSDVQSSPDNSDDEFSDEKQKDRFDEEDKSSLEEQKQFDVGLDLSKRG